MSIDRQPRVLFLGRSNSARSQMAEALLRHYGNGRYDVYSAGIEPGSVLREAIAVLHEQGIGAFEARAKTLDELAAMRFDYVITLCDGETQTPTELAGDAEHFRWHFIDPAAADGDRIEVLRRVRDEILSRIRYFILTDRPYE